MPSWTGWSPSIPRAAAPSKRRQRRCGRAFWRRRNSVRTASGSRYPPDSTCCVDIDGFALMVRYLSEHDSPDDPGGLIREVLQMGAEFPGPAEDVVLADRKSTRLNSSH